MQFVDSQSLELKLKELEAKYGRSNADTALADIKPNAPSGPTVLQSSKQTAAGSQQHVGTHRSGENMPPEQSGFLDGASLRSITKQPSQAPPYNSPNLSALGSGLHPVKISLYDPRHSHYDHTLPGSPPVVQPGAPVSTAIAAAVTTARILDAPLGSGSGLGTVLQPLGNPRSNWELSRAHAVLSMEQQISKLQDELRHHKLQADASGTQPGASQHGGQPTQGHMCVDTQPVTYYPGDMSAIQQGSGHGQTADGAGNMPWPGSGPAAKPPPIPGTRAAAAAAAAALLSAGVQLNSGSALYPGQRLLSLAEAALAGPSNSSSGSSSRGGSSAGSAAAAGLGVGAAGGSWERSKSAALLSLERERDALAHQLDQYSRLDRVHKQQLVEVHAKHAKALKDAQVGLSHEHVALEAVQASWPAVLLLHLLHKNMSSSQVGRMACYQMLS